MKKETIKTCKDCLYFHQNSKPVYFKNGSDPEYICLENKVGIDPQSKTCEKFEEGFEDMIQTEVAQKSQEI